MLEKIQKPEEAYYDLYKGKTVVVKVGGKELADPTAFETVTSTAKSFAEQGINVVFVYDGEKQIDEKWNEKHPGQPRPKRDGIGITTRKIMDDAVLPAARDLAHQMYSAFAYLDSSNPKKPVPKFVQPSELVAEIHRSPDNEEEFSAELVEITADLRDRQLQGAASTLHIIGFIGNDPAAARRYEYNNAYFNADGTVTHLAQHYGDLIDEVLFVTETGGVQDTSGKIVPILTKKGLKLILEGKHGSIKVDGDMRKKLEEIRAMLEENLDKAAITDASGLKQEIEYWGGSGTLCINEDKATFSKASDIELAVFNAVYADYVAKGIFRMRTTDELVALGNIHYILRVKNSPLAGFSFMPVDSEWSEIAALWSGYIRNGIGTILMKKMLELIQASGKKTYALTNSEDGESFFKKAGFTCHGTITELQLNQPFPLPAALANYALTPGRKQPVVFTYSN